jgi:hypothetical protein
MRSSTGAQSQGKQMSSGKGEEIKIADAHSDGKLHTWVTKTRGLSFDYVINI